MREGWKYKKLGEVLIFDKRFNGIPKEEQPTTTSFTHVSAEVLKSLKTDGGDVRLLSTGLFSASTTVDLAGDYLNEGEVITIPSGGEANIKYYKGKFVDSGNILGIASNPQIFLRFIYYCLVANNDLITSFFRGVSIKHPYMPDIYKILVPVPPLSEQERIVSELDHLSSIIEKKKEQLKAYDQLAQSIFYDMFGDPIENERGWEVKRLGEVCTFSQGVQVDVSEQITIKKDGWNRFLRIVDYTTDNSDIRYVKIDNPKYILNKDDIAMVRYGASVGVSDCGKEGVLANNLFKIDYTKQFYDKHFLLFSFHTTYFDSFIEKVAFGAAMPALSFGVMRDFQIFLPPLSLQQSFAEKIEAIEKQKALVQQSIVETQTMFDFTMDKYFG